MTVQGRTLRWRGKDVPLVLSGQGSLDDKIVEARASFELLLREEMTGERPPYFRVESWRTIVERAGSRGTEATAEATQTEAEMATEETAEANAEAQVNGLEVHYLANREGDEVTLETVDALNGRVVEQGGGVVNRLAVGERMLQIL